MTKKLLTRTALFSMLVITAACSSDDITRNEDGFRIIPPSQPTPLIQPSAFYVLNESSITHEPGGTINALDYDLKPTYRIYNAANTTNDYLGVTSTMGVAYGDHYFLVSKQGDRLIVTDKAFKKTDAQKEINGDGRAFVGISADKGYISTSKGITIYHINTKTVGKTIDGIHAETGNMVYANGKVYAVVRGVGLVVIDGKTDTVLETKAGAYTQATLDRHGIVWAGKETEIERIDPTNNANNKVYPIPTAPIQGKWAAWNLGSMSPSMQEDVIYWIANDGAWNGGDKIAKFDTQTGELNSEFYALGKDDMGNALEFYAAGMRVDPIKDELVLTIKREGWGASGSYNWTRILTNTGAVKGQVFMAGDIQNEMNGNYWFPAMTFFQDNNAPEILANQIVLKPNKEFRVALKEIVIDQDNSYASIEKSVSHLDNEFGFTAIEGDELVIKTNEKTGKTSMSMHVLSNGKSVHKNIEIWVRD